MDNSRLNKSVFLWAYEAGHSSVNKWCHKIRSLCADLNVPECANTGICNVFELKHLLDITLWDKTKTDWQNVTQRESATSGLGRNKLRTYILFKSCFGSEYYLSSVKCKSHKSALAKFRYGVAPINIELGLYVGTPPEQRNLPKMP